MIEGFESTESSLDIPQLRIKKLPLILLGRCAKLIGHYQENERVTVRCFDNYSMDNLQCTTSRIVTSKGGLCLSHTYFRSKCLDGLDFKRIHRSIYYGIACMLYL